MTIDITDAIPADLPELCRLLALLFDQEVEFRPDVALQSAGLRRIIDHPELGRILVARRGIAPIGMVNLLFTVSTALGGPVALLEDLVVDPEHRDEGVGAALIEAAVEAARSAGCRRITLLTDRVNEAAQRLYLRHGFECSEMMPMRRLL